MPTHARDRIAASCRGFDLSGPTRRAALRAGALSLSGLTMGGWFRARQAVAAPTVAPARSCILIFMWGGPSHLDTWDLKPDAPSEVRGPFRPIATSVPGVQIGEHFPRLAGQMHRIALVRSMSHDDPAHLSTAHRVLTGHLAPREKSDADGPSANDWPHLGSLLARVKPREGTLPMAVTMPWVVAHPAAPGGRAPGQDAGWLGRAFDPMRLEGDPNAPGFQVPGMALPEGLDAERLAARRGLLSGLGSGGAAALDAGPPASWDRFRVRALDTLGSRATRLAFDIDREDPRTRDRYGRNIHGQCLLMARRLVEAGVNLVTVNWQNDGMNFWDTHGDNFNQLQNRLMPPADQGFAALLDDLDVRGMLDETLVVWVGEFGRTPRITAGNAGREHWPRCYSAAMAGGGVRGGRVWGASDKLGAYPARDPVSPEDLGATILHALGVDPATQIPDPLGRPMRINLGSPLTGLFA
jgi:hypothetical protein